jgi:hypothetical protein
MNQKGKTVPRELDFEVQLGQLGRVTGVQVGIVDNGLETGINPEHLPVVMLSLEYRDARDRVRQRDFILPASLAAGIDGQLAALQAQHLTSHERESWDTVKAYAIAEARNCSRGEQNPDQGGEPSPE